MVSLFSSFLKNFSNDIGIDLGTANTLVYIRGKGIVINEPSVVAVNKKTDQVVAVGRAAKEMLGRTPAHIEAIRPLVDGVISDFEITHEMLSYLLRMANDLHPKSFPPRVVVGVPSGITNVEHRAVYDATKAAGAREVYIVEEPMAAALGVGLPVNDAVGSMIIDIGGGTTDIAVLSLGGIVRSKNLRIAGDRLNTDIMNYVRDEYKLLIGEKTAEDLKIAIGNVMHIEYAEAHVKGRDLLTGLPREILVTDTDIREAILPSVHLIVNAVKEVLETTPPEILGDIMQRGVMLAGGGALLRGFPTLLKQEAGVTVVVADDPLAAVARGAGLVLEHFELYKHLVTQEDYVQI